MITLVIKGFKVLGESWLDNMISHSFGRGLELYTINLILWRTQKWDSNQKIGQFDGPKNVREPPSNRIFKPE